MPALVGSAAADKSGWVPISPGGAEKLPWSFRGSGYIKNGILVNSKLTTYYLANESMTKLIAALNYEGGCGLCSYRGRKKNVRRHAPTHVGRFYCCCGYNSINRDQVTTHHRIEAPAHAKTIYIVDKASFPVFMQEMRVKDPQPYGFSKVVNSSKSSRRKTVVAPSQCIIDMQLPTAPAVFNTPTVSGSEPTRQPVAISRLVPNVTAPKPGPNLSAPNVTIATPGPNAAVSEPWANVAVPKAPVNDQPRVVIARSAHLDSLVMDLMDIESRTRAVQEHLTAISDAVGRCKIYCKDLTKQLV